MATWHDIHVTAEQAGTVGRRTDATARAVIECAADAIVAFSTVSILEIVPSGCMQPV